MMFRALLAGMVVGVFFAMVVVAEAAEKRPLEIEDLFRFKRVADPQISPDGRHVVYVVSTVNLEKNSSSANLWLAATDGSSPPRPITRTEKKDLHPRWSPDGNWILFESTRSGTMQLWAIALAGGEAAKLTDVATGAGTATWSPDGKSIAFVSAVYPDIATKPFAESNKLHQEKMDAIAASPVQAKVFTRLFFRHWDSHVEDKRQHLFVISFDPATGTAGEPRDVTPGDRDAYPTSTTFSVGDDFCFSPDGTQLIFTAVPSENEAWNTNYDLCRIPVTGSSKEWEVLVPRAAAGSGFAAEGAPVFSPDGKFFAFRAQAKAGYEADKWNLFVVPCDAAGTWKGPPVCLTKDLDRSVDSVFWKPQADGGPRVGFTCQEQGRMVWYLADPLARVFSDRSAKLVPQVQKQATSVDALTFDREGRNATYLGSRLDNPPEVYIGDRCLSQANFQAVNGITWGTVESLVVEGADGDPMQMWIVKPPQFDPAKKWPLAFLVHGGPQGAWTDSWSNRWNPQVWAAQGYVVALPNPRGSTGFGQEYTDQISGDWGGRCYTDLMAGLAHLESLPFIDAGRMFSAGASFGGYMMNWFQGKPHKFKTLICHCGVYNFESMYALTEELWFDEYEHGGPPWGDHRDSYEKHSPHRFAASFKTPMLIIHNDLDFRVPVSEGLQMFTTLQRLNVPSKLINFPDEGHWVLKPANSKFWHEQIFAWLKDYCPPGPK